MSEGLRLESSGNIRVTLVSPGVTQSELAESISDPAAREYTKSFRANAIPASSIADAIAYAIAQPPSVDVSDIIVQPAANV
jgi:NADP-dependent 3-hydroxy acid dehydrogenase YdfG